jgi:hypothetical protein
VNARKIKAFAQKVKGSEVINLPEPFFLSLQNFQIFPEPDNNQPFSLIAEGLFLFEKEGFFNFLWYCSISKLI